MRAITIIFFVSTFTFFNLSASNIISHNEKHISDVTLDDNITTGSSITDSLALVAIFNAHGGPNWNNPWPLNSPMDTWHSIVLNANRRVVQLILNNSFSNPATGIIAPEIGDLCELEVLIIYDRYNLTGSIPTTIGNLTNLKRLEIIHNDLTGDIPSSIGNLTNLEYLSLRSNFLTGVIPSSIGNLTNLGYLYLAGNPITGSIPTTIGDLTNLKYLYLTILSSTTAGTGPIPTTIGDLTNLKYLSLGGDGLTGSIPATIGNLTNLEELHINYTNIGGAIPSSIGNLTNLDILRLSNNNLTGSIPPSIGYLFGLTRLYLNDNNLSGCIPAELTMLCPFLYNPDISNNPNLTNDTWTYFYNNEYGVCPPCTGCNCASHILERGSLLGLYQAQFVITSLDANIQQGTTVEFNAGEHIVLMPNFTVEDGAEFTIDIQTCN